MTESHSSLNDLQSGGAHDPLTGTQNDTARLIGQLTSDTGLEPKTVRYYERVGLLTPRRLGHMRVYVNDDVERLKVIKLLRDFDLPIRTIKSFIEADSGLRVDKLPEAAKTAIADRLELLRNEVEKLETLTRTQISP